MNLKKAIKNYRCRGSESLLTAEERADVLNALNKALEKFGLEVASYEDSDGMFFTVGIWKK